MESMLTNALCIVASELIFHLQGAAPQFIYVLFYFGHVGACYFCQITVLKFAVAMKLAIGVNCVVVRVNTLECYSQDFDQT
jgi:hypothetical protein